MRPETMPCGVVALIRLDGLMTYFFSYQGLRCRYFGRWRVGRTEMCLEMEKLQGDSDEAIFTVAQPCR